MPMETTTVTMAAVVSAADERLHGDRVIHGFVRDLNDQPVEGVLVVATPMLPDPRYRPLPGKAPRPVGTREEAVAAASRSCPYRHIALEGQVGPHCRAYCLAVLRIRSRFFLSIFSILSSFPPDYVSVNTCLYPLIAFCRVVLELKVES